MAARAEMCEPGTMERALGGGRGEDIAVDDPGVDPDSEMMGDPGMGGFAGMDDFTI